MKFLRENFVLVLGAALPLAFMLLFMSVKTVRERAVEPPRHTVIFAMKPYNDAYDIAVKGGELTIAFTAAKEGAPPGADTPLYIYTYDPLTNALAKMPVTLPDDVRAGKKITLDLPAALRNVRIDPSKSAPDGYEFRRARYRNGNIFTDIFGYNGPSGNVFALSHKGRFVKMPSVDEYGREQFIGWIIAP